jgi:prevent-host-death family protein
MSQGQSFVGVHHAKTHWALLLERAQRAEEITITRHGLPIVRLVPVKHRPTIADRRAVLDAMIRIAPKNRLRGLRIKDLIKEGRR